MTNDSLSQTLAMLRAFVAERDWSQFHDPKNLAMAVASEAGELLAEFRWVSNVRADDFASDPDRRTRIEHEIADVGISLLLLCDRTGIDLLDAIERKVELNARNYPVETARAKPDRETS